MESYKSGSSFACDMSVFNQEERARHVGNTKEVFKQSIERKEIPDGYEFVFPNESRLLINLIAFVEKERLCCPFFGFNIDIEPDAGNVHLKIYGRGGVKDFIKAEIMEFKNK